VCICRRCVRARLLSGWLFCARRKQGAATNSFSAAGPVTHSAEKRIMGGPVLLAQYKCRPLSRRQIKLSGRFVKARAHQEKECFEKWREMQKILYSFFGSLFAVRFNSLSLACVVGDIFCRRLWHQLCLLEIMKISHPEELNNTQKAPAGMLSVCNTARGRPASRAQKISSHTHSQKRFSVNCRLRKSQKLKLLKRVYLTMQLLWWLTPYFCYWFFTRTQYSNIIYSKLTLQRVDAGFFSSGQTGRILKSSLYLSKPCYTQGISWKKNSSTIIFPVIAYIFVNKRNLLRCYGV
jgi:hypothetical protein